MWLAGYFSSSVLVISWNYKKQREKYCIPPPYIFSCRMGIIIASSPSANPECQTSLVHDDLTRAIVKLMF